LLNNETKLEKEDREIFELPGVPHVAEGSLLKTIELEDFTYARQLLDEGKADLKETDKEGNTALHWLLWIKDRSFEERIALLRRLIKAGAPCNHQNIHGQTPLHLALYIYKNPWLAAELMSNGADCSIEDRQGRLPILTLILAMQPSLPWNTPESVQKEFDQQIFEGNDTNIEKYLSLGVAVNNVDGFGMTPLQRAAFLQKPVLAKKLIDCGAIIGKEGQGCSPYEFALINPPVKQELLEVLKKAHEDQMTLQKSFNCLDLSLVKKAIADGVSINMAIDEQGSLFRCLVKEAEQATKFPLQKAVCHKMAKWLALHGATC